MFALRLTPAGWIQVSQDLQTGRVRERLIVPLRQDEPAREPYLRLVVSNPKTCSEQYGIHLNNSSNRRLDGTFS